MLLPIPTKAEVARRLALYRAWERLLLAAPADRQVRANFEDTASRLCELMGKRCAREAADAAESCLRPRAPQPDRRPPPAALSTPPAAGLRRERAHTAAGGS